MSTGFDLVKAPGSRSGDAVFQPDFEGIDRVRALRVGDTFIGNGVACVLTADPVVNGDGSISVCFETRA